MRGFSYAERISPEEHAIAREALERAVELAPNYAYAWAMLSLTIKDEYESGFNPKPDPLERMLHAARRAVELDSSGHRGYHALAMAHSLPTGDPGLPHRRGTGDCAQPHGRMQRRPLGSYIAYAGEWERGCALVESALSSIRIILAGSGSRSAFNAYRKCDYRGALSYALKINLPNFFWTHLTLAAIYGQLGQHEEGSKSGAGAAQIESARGPDAASGNVGEIRSGICRAY